jgi:hypothetical protein
VARADLDQVIRLAHGVPDREPETPLFYELQRLGFADDGLPAVDAVVHQRLADLGQGFGWHVAHAKGHQDLVALLRRAHAQRKVSLFHLGQTACIPESGVARCLQLRQRVGPRKRVLLVGDDDLLCLPLARMGYRVTVLDIDATLVSFLQRVARQERLAVDVRLQDVLQPLPEDLVGAFDAVLTDPMSFESCLVAFLGRAVNVLKPGGRVFSCLHPLSRQLFKRVVDQLPLHVEECLYELSVYYYTGFVENWYRSDLYVMRRTEKPPPFGPGAVVPLGNIIEGYLNDRLHGFTDISGSPFKRPTVETLEGVVNRWVEVTGQEVKARQLFSDQGWAHLYVALGGGRHLALVMDHAHGSICYDLFPFSEELDEALTAVFAGVLALSRTVTFECITHDLASPTVVTRPRPRTVTRKGPARRRKD